MKGVGGILGLHLPNAEKPKPKADFIRKPGNDEVIIPSDCFSKKDRLSRIQVFTVLDSWLPHGNAPHKNAPPFSAQI